jgi:hypothetical protein
MIDGMLMVCMDVCPSFAKISVDLKVHEISNAH